MASKQGNPSSFIGILRLFTPLWVNNCGYNCFRFQLWPRNPTILTWFAARKSICATQYRSLGCTGKNKAKTAVSVAVKAKLEVEIWRRPKNQLFDHGFLFTPSDSFSLGRTVSPQYKTLQRQTDTQTDSRHYSTILTAPFDRVSMFELHECELDSFWVIANYFFQKKWVFQPWTIQQATAAWCYVQWSLWRTTFVAALIRSEYSKRLR